MRIRIGMGTTPTILVIVVTIGDGRPRAALLRAALRARPARARCADVTGIPATSATAPCGNAARVARRVATRLRACRWLRAACGERLVTPGRDAPATGVVVVAAGSVVAGVIATGVAAAGVVAAGIAATGVVAVVVFVAGFVAVGVFAASVLAVTEVSLETPASRGAVMANPLPEVVDRAARGAEWPSPALSPALPCGTRDVSDPMLSCR
jgi:hypothetical protein